MFLVVGQIFRAHGVHGELVVDIRTDDPADRFAVGSVLVTDSTAVRHLQKVPEGGWRPPSTVTVETVRPHQGKLLIVFEGIYDRGLAEDMRGVLLCVDRAIIPTPSDPDEFNDHDLVGLAIVGADGEKIGELLKVDHAPAHDLLVVRLLDGRTGLVPFVREIVPEVDVAGGRIVITPPEGLFDL